MYPAMRCLDRLGPRVGRIRRARADQGTRGWCSLLSDEETLRLKSWARAQGLYLPNGRLGPVVLCGTSPRRSAWAIAPRAMPCGFAWAVGNNALYGRSRALRVGYRRHYSESPVAHLFKVEPH
jgi:hypothetical protein